MQTLFYSIAIFLCVGICLRPSHAFNPISRKSVVRIQNYALHAKKASEESKGFGGGVKKTKATSTEPTTSSIEMNTATQTGNEQAPSTGGSASDAEIDAIFKKYGIKEDVTTQAQAKIKADAKKRAESGEDAPFGESIIAKLDPSLQLKLDNLLTTGVSLSLGFVILCGVGISAGALEVVFPTIDIPKSLDETIVNVLTPSFTPALGVFFFFSITFGLFKFAQISSSQTVYKE